MAPGFGRLPLFRGGTAQMVGLGPALRDAHAYRSVSDGRAHSSAVWTPLRNQGSPFGYLHLHLGDSVYLQMRHVVKVLQALHTQ